MWVKGLLKTKTGNLTTTRKAFLKSHCSIAFLFIATSYRLAAVQGLKLWFSWVFICFIIFK